jgi:hypothetical protein
MSSHPIGKAGPLLLEEQGAGLITIKAQPDGTSIQDTRASRRVRETALGSVSRARPRGLALVRGRASMTPRERVLTALQHERPDRTPCDFWAEPPTWKVLPCSTPEQVRAIAQRYCSSLGAGGGYILGPRPVPARRPAREHSGRLRGRARALSLRRAGDDSHRLAARHGSWTSGILLNLGRPFRISPSPRRRTESAGSTAVEFRPRRLQWLDLWGPRRTDITQDKRTAR